MKQTQCECPIEYQIGVQYDPYYDPVKWPNHYDGVSEYGCTKCRRRWGRWTGEELAKGEEEPRYGKK